MEYPDVMVREDGVEFVQVRYGYYRNVHIIESYSDDNRYNWHYTMLKYKGFKPKAKELVNAN